MTIQMKTTEHYFTVVLFIVLLQGGFSSFEIVDEIQTVIIQVKVGLLAQFNYQSML